MTHQPYDLLDEPWIDVLTQEDQPSSLGLRDVFRGAHQLKAIKGDLPTQDVAILRLLLAILRRSVVDALEESESPVRFWSTLHSAETLPLDLIEPYLEKYQERFDLKSPDAPFFQVPHDAGSKHSGLQKLIADLPDTEDKQLFSARAGDGARSLSLAEAARWLVHVHAFDPSGIKTGLMGDSRAKGGKGYPIGLGWSGYCGLLMAQGTSLKETLLLNLVLRAEMNPDDVPPWELPPAGPDARTQRRGVPAVVEGPTQAMTWQTRRVILRFDENGERVVDVTLGNGDPVSPENQWGIEDHTAWRFSANKSKKGSDVFFPLGVNPDKALWRGISGVLAIEPTRGRVTSKPAPQHRAGLVDWLARLVDRRALPATRRIPLVMTGAVYGTQNSVIDHVMSDALTLPSAVLAQESLQHLAVNAVADAEGAVTALRGLARDLCRAAGLDSGDGAADDISRRAYSDLGRRFSLWVAALRPETDPAIAEVEWQRAVRTLVRPLAQELVRDAGTAALVGRGIERLGGRVEHLDVGSAWARFQWSLDRALALTAPVHTSSDDTASATEGA